MLSPEESKSLSERIRASMMDSEMKGGNGKIHIGDGDEYPSLLALLSVVPGAPKGVPGGRVSFFLQDGRLTCCFSHPFSDAVAFKALPAFKDALYEGELYLRANDLQWRKNKPKGR